MMTKMNKTAGATKIHANVASEKSAEEPFLDLADRLGVMKCHPRQNYFNITEMLA